MELVNIRINEKEETIHSLNIDNDNYNVSRSCEETYYNMHHIHTSYEILFIERGIATYFVGGKGYRLCPGDVLVIGATEHHKRVIEEVPFQRYGLTIKPSYFRSIAPELNLEKVFETPSLEAYERNYKNISQESFSLIVTLLRLLKSEQLSQNVYRSSMERTIIVQLTILLYRIFGFKQDDTPKSPIHGQMMEIKDYITSNYSEEVNLKILADKFYLHPSTISKCFSQYCGQNLNKYINQVRISEATKLLEKTNDSVLLIAQKCGYENETTFSRQFKNTMEISPARYRRALNEYEYSEKSHK